MTEGKVRRASDDEHIVFEPIDKKKLITVMKRFLGSKKSDPEVTKWFKVEGGVHYLATNLGSAVQILLHNRYAGSYTENEKPVYIKPLSNENREVSDFIPEIETVSEGKKKKERKTGKALEFPDVRGMFRSYDLSMFYKIPLDMDAIADLIAVHEAMKAASKVGGDYNTAELNIYSGDNYNRLKISLYDSPLSMSYWREFDSEQSFNFGAYHYDYELMIAVLKSLKDLESNYVNFYVRNIDDRLFFVGKANHYDLNFAIQRKLVR